MTTWKRRNNSFVGRLLNGVRPIPKKLFQHKVISSIRITIGAITFATLVFAGFYGYTALMHQQQVVADANLRRVVAEIVNYNDINKRWTDKSVAELARLPIVEFGYPRKEITVQLTLIGQRYQFTSLDGVIGREPELQNASLVWGRPVARESRPEIVLSLNLFERLGGRCGAMGPNPSEVTLIVTRVVSGVTETQRLGMRVAGLLRRDTDKVYGPLDLAINLDRWQTHKSDSPLGESSQSVDSRVVYDCVDVYVPEKFTEQVAVEETTFGVRAEQVGPVEIVESPGDTWARITTKHKQVETNVEGIRRALASVPHELWPERPMGAGDDDRDQAHNGLGNNPMRQSILGDDVIELQLAVRLPNNHALYQAERRLNDIGCSLETLVDLNRLRFVKYAVRLAEPNGTVAPIPSAKADQLIMAQPTFQMAVPRMTVTASVADTETLIVSTSGENDPLWFETRVIAGAPLVVGEESPGLCLPQQLAERAFPGLTLDEIIGRTVSFRIGRYDDDSLGDLAVRLRVDAITELGRCVAPLKTVAAWRHWKDGRLVYDSASKTFRTPSEVYERRGFIAAVFYASSDNVVETLVTYLKSIGCDVKHHLDQKDRLIQLAVAVTTLVVLFVSGSFLNASANSCAVSWMDLTTKLKEIGVKMAYGVTRVDITFAYLAEGFLVGIAACVCGTVLVAATEPILRDLIFQTVGLDRTFYLVPIYSSRIGWLYAVAAFVVVGFNMLGTLIPTWIALRKSPTDLMR